MKASELLEVFEDFIYNRYTPSDEGVRLGCDCGCGGDCYDWEDWDRAHEEVYKARANLRDVLISLNISIDIPELIDVYNGGGGDNDI